MHLSSESKSLLRVQTLKHLPHPLENSIKSSENSKKLPSSVISITNQGEELSLRPSPPHQSTCSTASRDSNSMKTTKHSRCSTVSSGIFKFIPATEFVSFEEIQTQNEENYTEEISEELVSSLTSEEEHKHFSVYPTLHNNRNSMIATNTGHLVVSITSSPLEQRASTIYTLSSTTSCKNSPVYVDNFYKKSKKSDCFEGKSKENGLGQGKVYCETCKENVGVNMKVRDHKGNFWERMCCGVLCENSLNFIERVMVCQTCRKELAKIKVKKEDL